MAIVKSDSFYLFLDNAIVRIVIFMVFNDTVLKVHHQNINMNGSNDRSIVENEKYKFLLRFITTRHSAKKTVLIWKIIPSIRSLN